MAVAQDGGRAGLRAARAAVGHDECGAGASREASFDGAHAAVDRGGAVRNWRASAGDRASDGDGLGGRRLSVCVVLFVFFVFFLVGLRRRARGCPGDDEDAEECRTAAVEEGDELVEGRLLEVTVENGGPDDSRKVEGDELGGDDNL